MFFIEFPTLHPSIGKETEATLELLLLNLHPELPHATAVSTHASAVQLGCACWKWPTPLTLDTVTCPGTGDMLYCQLPPNGNRASVQEERDQGACPGAGTRQAEAVI